MEHEKEYFLQREGFKKIRGFSRYMIKKNTVVNIKRLRKMATRSDKRINLIKDNGKRTCLNISMLKILSKE